MAELGAAVTWAEHSAQCSIPVKLSISDTLRLRKTMSLVSYIKQLSKYVLSSSIVLGLIVGISLLYAGETTMDVDLTLEFGAFDGLVWIVGLPLLSTLVFVILSPLSFWIHRLMSRNRTENSGISTPSQTGV